MATFRGSNHQISASSVWTNGDLANLIDNLYRQSIRAGARGEYERGLRDMAQAIAAAYSVAGGIDAVVKPDEPTLSKESESAVGWSLVFGVLAIIVAVVML